MEITTDNYLIVDILKVLANETRLKILQYCINGMSLSRLPRLVGVSQSLVSRYVREMEDLGLITTEKIGINKVVKLADDTHTIKILPISFSGEGKPTEDLL